MFCLDCEHNYIIIKTTHDAYHKMCFKCGDKRIEEFKKPEKKKGVKALFTKGG